jgi:hypothetical protein
MIDVECFDIPDWVIFSDARHPAGAVYWVAAPILRTRRTSSVIVAC